MKNTLLLIPIILTGCAIATSPRLKLTTTSTMPNGIRIVEERESKGMAFIAWGDAKTMVEKSRISNGKTQSIGLSGFDTEVTSTNLPANLKAGGDLIGSAVAEFMKKSVGIP